MSVSYNWVTERIAVGGLIGNKDGLEELIQAGITGIIDMQAEMDDDTYSAGEGRVSICWLPQNDDGTPRPKEQVLKGIGYGLGCLSMVGGILNQKIYCHCAAGVNRGPTMCYAILRAFGIPQQEAIDRIRTARPQVNFFNVPAYISSVEEALK